MFLCRLAVTFGVPPSEVESRFTEDDVCYLRAYFELEPFGDAADWTRHGAQMAQNLNLWAKDNPATPSDYIPPTLTNK